MFIASMLHPVPEPYCDMCMCRSWTWGSIRCCMKVRWRGAWVAPSWLSCMSFCWNTSWCCCSGRTIALCFAVRAWQSSLAKRTQSSRTVQSSNSTTCWHAALPPVCSSHYYLMVAVWHSGNVVWSYLMSGPPLLLLLHSFNGLFSRTTWVSWYQKDRTSLDWNEARDDGVWGCCGISWTICKQSAPCSRQITIPAPHHSFFTGQMLFLMLNQRCQGTEGLESVCALIPRCRARPLWYIASYPLHSSFYPTWDEKWVLAKVRWCSVAGE